MLSIEITRECPLTCPGCYAYGDTHLGGGVTLTRTKRSPRRRTSRRRPATGPQAQAPARFPGRRRTDGPPSRAQPHPSSPKRDATSSPWWSPAASSPFPCEWMKLPRVRVAISVDGLPEHHDIRRKPATYERILANIEGREVNIHWVITRPMIERPGYLEEYVKFWSERQEVNRIWVSVYTPQIGEQSPEMLTPENRLALAAELPALAKRYQKAALQRRLRPSLSASAGRIPTIAFSPSSPQIIPPISKRA